MPRKMPGYEKENESKATGHASHTHPSQPHQTTKTPASTAPSAPPPATGLVLNGSRLLTSWLAEQHLSLVFTTYTIGKVFLVGLQPPDGRLSVSERTFNRCMGLSTNSDTIYMSSLYQLWRFENMLPPNQRYGQYDKLYVPQMSYTTGDIDIHDIGVDQTTGKVVFVSTLFSCVATTSETKSFEVLWKPQFISRIAAEDRCHLNGLAFRDGRPRYVTMVSQTDVNEGWREHRHSGGIMMDIHTNTIIAKGLSMPHSPRWHNGKLWLLNSGKGEFGYIDVDNHSNGFTPVAFCPGYARGLQFHGDYAVIGLSKSRHNKTFSDLSLQQQLDSKQISSRCGIQVVNMRTYDVVHHLSVEGGVSGTALNEIYDVGILPNVCCPTALGFRNENEIRRIISFDDRTTKAPEANSAATQFETGTAESVSGSHSSVSPPLSSSPHTLLRETPPVPTPQLEQQTQDSMTSTVMLCRAMTLFAGAASLAIAVGWLLSGGSAIEEGYDDMDVDAMSPVCGM